MCRYCCACTKCAGGCALRNFVWGICAIIPFHAFARVLFDFGTLPNWSFYGRHKLNHVLFFRLPYSHSFLIMFMLWNFVFVCCPVTGSTAIFMLLSLSYILWEDEKLRNYLLWNKYRRRCTSIFENPFMFKYFHLQYNFNFRSHFSWKRSFEYILIKNVKICFINI